MILGGQAGAGSGSIGTMSPEALSNTFTDTKMDCPSVIPATWSDCQFSNTADVGYPEICQPVAFPEQSVKNSTEWPLGYAGKELAMILLINLTVQFRGIMSLGA